MYRSYITGAGKGLRTIGWQSFSYSGITSLKLPDSVELLSVLTHLETSTSLTSVEWPDNENFTTVQGFEYCEISYLLKNLMKL